jgi:MoxR-like ATPase
MATQNPIEQEGTYPLPEAQMDRFLMHVNVGYPEAKAERDILKLARNEAMDSPVEQVEEVSEATLLEARKEVLSVHMAEPVEEYIVQLILATREPAQYGGQLANWLDYGASPRATISLDRCARAHAWLNARDYVSPDDVRAVAHDVLRHRLILSFEAEANGVNADQVIDTLINTVPSA